MFDILPAWMNWIIAIAVVGGSLTAVVKGGWLVWKYLAALTQQLTKFNEGLPTLLSIASEFKNNGGNSLRDAIDRIEKKANTAAAEAKIVREMTEAQTKILKKLPCSHDEDGGCEIRT